ncbi:deoxyribodipyrimidine photo-lyase [Aquimarina sp. TRL1]|uniref:cryptochrome/photolyase family protein n=1 Tax=Aquimarina sp. (strain TRL1) TaxID=2736252 RepID=UPI00158F56C4|nr:deoxyribodipyrimidine photo-lyase [Aquimarina sp. TRL1]QKX06896.1 deoxyribodipyrimidine photo-lyase [Aquimarina sp. TRL1]
MKQKVVIHWFRRDLRLYDNTALHHALSSGLPVIPVFIFDTGIISGLPEDDARISFIYSLLKNIQDTLENNFSSSIHLYHTNPETAFIQICNDYDVQAVYTNHDYEPYATERDTCIGNFLKSKNISWHTYKDQVIFEKEDIVKKDNSPYIVYTPYKNKWLEKFDSSLLVPFSIKGNNFASIKKKFPTLTEIGFKVSDKTVTPYDLSSIRINNYEETRNFPAIASGTSRLGPYLRFGVLSIREVVQKAIEQPNKTFLSELIWREFFMQILWHFPHTPHSAFKPKYDRIPWRNNEIEFEKWKKGLTGYPLVDAGMRQLQQTGYMHNRVRMVVASFLCKHLLIDWRWGEAYFAETLLDYELAANVGNWQWASGSGVDAAPYFRIFNPTTQITKFDKSHSYIKTWVKDLQELSYPTPIVDHKTARERCLETYKKALL